MRIREFKISDYDAVDKLWKDAKLINRPGDDRNGVELKLQRDADLFLVATENEDIVGVVMGAWDGRRGWINHLAVRPSKQRTGIDQILIAELENRLKKKGAKKVNAQIYKWNKQSIEFFKAVGYEVHTDLIMVGKILADK